ncbi:MAG: carbohydrate binding domain-containing protein, partial [Candidatus Latescibacteria bacterium]|nr:carbohydrate binding domain-containing protein [Candidatus Latescibacterota bacterium]
MIRWMCCFLLFVGQIQSELLNGGFERIDKTHVPIGWTPVPDSVQVVAERSNAHGGKALAHLLVEQAHQTVGLMSNSVSVQAGAFYVLTGWARVANEGHRAVVQVRWLSGDRTVIGFEQTTENTSESWAQVAGTFVAPEKAVACRVVCLAKGGEAFFDDMVLN